MSFFDNIYRLYGQNDDLNPDNFNMPEMDQVEFEDPDPTMATPTEPMQPRVIPPRYARPGFDTYMQHIKNMPTESQYAPGTGRKIGAALVGFAAGLKNPSAGYAMTEGILRSPYARAMDEWKAKGGALKDVTTEEGNYNEMMSKEGVEGGKLDIRGKELEAKKTQIENTYQVGMKNAKSTEERNLIAKQRNDDLKALAIEANKTDRIQAGASVTSANAATVNAEANTTRANAYADDVANRPDPQVIPPKIGDMDEAEAGAARHLYATYPNLRKFFTLDEDGNLSLNMDQEWTPEEFRERERAMQLLGSEAQKRLGGQAVGGATPLRPRVITPPNRRRIR